MFCFYFHTSIFTRNKLIRECHLNRVAAKKNTLNGLSMHQLSKLICKKFTQKNDLFLNIRLIRSVNKNKQNENLKQKQFLQWGWFCSISQQPLSIEWKKNEEELQKNIKLLFKLCIRVEYFTAGKWDRRMQNLPIINSAIHIFILDYEQFCGDFEVALIQIDQCRLFFFCVTLCSVLCFVLWSHNFISRPSLIFRLL